MKQLLILLMCCLAAACVTTLNDDIQMMSAFNPSVKPDGTQAFTFVTGNRLPSFVQPTTSLRDFHMQLLGQKLAAQRYCMQGYTIVAVDPIEPNVMYSGLCNK